MKTLIYSNLFIALCAAILTLGSYGLLDLTPDPHLVLHVFGVTLMAYNIQRLVRMRKFSNRTDQIRWYLKNKWMLYTSLFIGMLVSTWTFVHLPIRLLLAFAPLAIISFFYSLPILPQEEGKRAFRDIPGIKIFVIAGVWVGVTWILPVAESGVPWELKYVLIGIERFLFILAITIPFDIRDLKYDDDSMKTIPQLLGYSKSKDLAQLLLAICIVISLYVEYFELPTRSVWEYGWSALVYAGAAAIIARMRADSSDLLFTGLLDGTMLLLGLVLMIN